MEIELSIITSCAPEPIRGGGFLRWDQINTKHVIERLQKANVSASALDLYCFHFGDMGDSEDWHLFPATETQRLVDAVATIADKDRAIHGVATKLATWARPFNLRAFATNLPAISSTNEQRRRKAVKALWAVCQIADYLDVPCVEAVGGADFGRWGSKDKWIIEASWQSYEERCHALLKSLHSLRTLMDRNEINGVAIALELEPGPSYLLNSVCGRPFCGMQRPSALQRVMKELPAKYVGLNLDIGHFLRLEAVEPDLLAHVYSEYLDRVLHAHASRHTGIHGQDLYLRSEDYAECKRWLKVFCDSMSCDRDSVPTKTVAVELEACHRTEWIEKSLRILRNWLEDKMGISTADPPENPPQQHLGSEV